MIILKESKNKDKYLDLARELKMSVEHERDLSFKLVL